MQQSLLAVAAASAPALKRAIPVVLALSILLCAAKPSDARGLGGFLEALLARGLVRGAIIAGRSNSQPQYLPKSYTPDVLTVEQLANCIKKAGKLDGDSQQLEVIRTALLASKSEIDLSSATVDFQRTRVEHYSQKSVDAFILVFVLVEITHENIPSLSSLDLSARASKIASLALAAASSVRIRSASGLVVGTDDR